MTPLLVLILVCLVESALCHFHTLSSAYHDVDTGVFARVILPKHNAIFNDGDIIEYLVETRNIPAYQGPCDPLLVFFFLKTYRWLVRIGLQVASPFQARTLNITLGSEETWGDLQPGNSTVGGTFKGMSEKTIFCCYFSEMCFLQAPVM